MLDSINTAVFETMAELGVCKMVRVDGKDVRAVFDGDQLKRRGDRAGGYIGDTLMYAYTQDFPTRPVAGKQLRIDGKLMRVVQCVELDGVMEITLEGNMV